MKSRGRMSTPWAAFCATLLVAAGGSTCQTTMPMTMGCTGGTAVNVGLIEFKVMPSAAATPAGCVMFHVTNNGVHDHEFLVIRTDLPEDQLPTEADGSYQEDGPGTMVVDEIQPFPAGQSRDLGVTLTAGKYVLICNVHTIEAHYALGMHVAFTVN